jgi:hypothetical protein
LGTVACAGLLEDVVDVRLDGRGAAIMRGKRLRGIGREVETRVDVRSTRDEIA